MRRSNFCSAATGYAAWVTVSAGARRTPISTNSGSRSTQAASRSISGGNVESPRSDIGRNHHFVFAALESLEGLDPFALGAIRMQNCDGMVPMF